VNLSSDRIRAVTGLAIGALVGVAMLTKLPCLTLALLTVIAILVRSSGRQAPAAMPKEAGKASTGKKGKSKSNATRQESSPQPFKAIAVAAGIALIICGWWLVRNQLLYGDPFAWKAFVNIFGKGRPTPESFLSKGFSFLTYLGVVGVYTFKTFWGTFGQANIFLPGWLYEVWLAVSGLILLGWIKNALERRRRVKDEPEIKFARWILLLQIIFLFAFFMRFNTTFFQGQARYLLSAVTPIAIFLAQGLLGAFPIRWRKQAAYSLSVVFFAYSFAALFFWGLPGYLGNK
jgi:hypothetical protein